MSPRSESSVRADYDVTYANDKKTVLMKANLANGWRRLEKTYGFFRQMWIYYPGDFRVRTMLTLLAQPATFHESAEQFPDVALLRGNELIHYQIEDKVRIALCEEQPWRLMMGKRPGIFFEDLGLDIGQARFWLDLRLWLVFHPPGRAPIPDVRVWCQKLFVPGGQSESNRRRH